MVSTPVSKGKSKLPVPRKPKKDDKDSAVGSSIASLSTRVKSRRGSWRIQKLNYL